MLPEVDTPLPFSFMSLSLITTLLHPMMCMPLKELLAISDFSTTAFPKLSMTIPFFAYVTSTYFRIKDSVSPPTNFIPVHWSRVKLGWFDVKIIWLLLVPIASRLP